MATAIFFGGRRINIPGAYSEIDASALAGLSPGAVGIVALIGTAEGGVPLSVDSSDADHTRSETVLQRYRSGDLRVAGQFAFAPSNDEAIPGGAQRLVAVKVNPATQSSVTLPDANALDAVDLTSVDYGLFTSQINIEVAAGTNQGKLITIVFEDTTEVLDDVGGDAVMDAEYTPGANGWDSANLLVSTTNVIINGLKTEAGLAAEVASVAPAGFPSVVDVVSSAAGDTTQTITFYGLDGSGAPQRETISLNGTTNVQGTLTWTKVLGGVASAATVGTITVSDFPVATTIMTFAPATLTRGVALMTNGITADTPIVQVSATADEAVDVAYFGLSPAGVPTGEVFDFTTINTTPLAGAVDFSQIDVIALGELTGGNTAISAVAVAAANKSIYTTIQKVVDLFNSKAGLAATALVSNPTTFAVADLDILFPVGVSVLSTTGELFADLFFFIEAINNGSGLITAARATGAELVPANTVGPVFLTGGVEGTPTITEWQQAFTLLKQRRVNIIVPLTNDPAVHSLLITHLRERAGQLRSEANGYVGIGTAGGAGETKANIKSQIQVLGTRHVSALSEEPQRFDPDSGLATFYPPYIYGAIAAGMQAGSPVGEPLTFKRPLVTDVRRDSSWNPIDDGEELIDAGLMFTELQDGVGFRFVRSITTHLADDNVVFTEMSANESANTAVFELRTALEQKIGRRGLVGTVAAIKGLANDTLSRLLDDEIIFGYRALEVEQVGDVFPVSVEIAPILPINFIPITVHLVAARAAA